MNATLQRKRYFGSPSFYKKVLLIALPVMAQQLIQNMVSLIDNFMVSGLGDVKMSGVNITGQILFIFMVLMNTVCMSGGIFMTQYSGANDKDGMKQAFCFKLIFGFLATCLYSVVCFVFNRRVLSLMVIGNSQASEILDIASEYMFLMGFMGIPMMISASISSSLREIGRVKVPLVISVIATLVNTFLNFVLIYGNLGAPRLEVKGAAYATLIARFIELGLFLGYVLLKNPPFRANITDFLRINFKLILEILKKGSMILFSEMLWVLSETVTTALYNGRGGADVVSGMAASFAIVFWRHYDFNRRYHRADFRTGKAQRGARAKTISFKCGCRLRHFHGRNRLLHAWTNSYCFPQLERRGSAHHKLDGGIDGSLNASLGLCKHTVRSFPRRRRHSSRYVG